jgi:polynucleotide 5'-hydroxyl-kinase GRC3/NOL9
LGRTVSFIDADVGQKTVGPPGTVGLKHIRETDDLTHDRMAEADLLGFVGSITPQGHVVSLIGALQRLLDRSRQAGADLVVVDTSSLVSGIYGQLVKFHKVDILEPDLVIGLQRGEELEPIMGIVQRFFGVETLTAGIHPSVTPTSVEERAEQRREAMARYFDRPLQRFRIRPTVFMPTLPPLFELEQLDRLIVGLSDGEAGYTGIGYLEYGSDESLLRLYTPVAEAPKALRLGSVRLEDDFRARRVDLQNLFGTE